MKALWELLKITAEITAKVLVFLIMFYWLLVCVRLMTSGPP